VSATALRTLPVNDTPPDTKASVDTKHPTVSTAAARSRQADERILYWSRRIGKDQLDELRGI